MPCALLQQAPLLKLAEHQSVAFGAAAFEAIIGTTFVFFPYAGMLAAQLVPQAAQSGRKARLALARFHCLTLGDALEGRRPFGTLAFNDDLFLVLMLGFRLRRACIEFLLELAELALHLARNVLLRQFARVFVWA